MVMAFMRANWNHNDPVTYSHVKYFLDASVFDRRFIQQNDAERVHYKTDEIGQIGWSKVDTRLTEPCYQRAGGVIF